MITKNEEKKFVQFLDRGQPPYENILMKHSFPRIKAVLQGKIIPPYEVEIQTSSYCNLSCDFCFGKGCNAIRGLMGKKELEEIAKKINDFQEDGFKIEIAKFCGITGEPLFTPVVAEGIKLFKEQGKKIVLYTNGLNLDQKIGNDGYYYDHILQIDRLNLSLDAGSEEVFINLKGKPGFNRIIKSLEKIIEKRSNNLNVVVSYVAGEKNYNDIVNATRIAKQAGADEISFRIDFLKPDEKEEIKKIIIRNIEEAKKYADKNFIVDSAYSKDEIIKGDGAFHSQKEGRKCYTHYFWASISPRGELYACGHRTHNGVASYGNLLTNSFRDLWINQARQDNVKSLPDETCKVCSPSSYRRNDFMGFLSTLQLEDIDYLHEKYIGGEK